MDAEKPTTIEEVETVVQAPKDVKEDAQDTAVLPPIQEAAITSPKSLIYKFAPMGRRVIVNAPFITNGLNALFAIRITPYSPPLVPYSAATGNNHWIYNSNNTESVVHDPPYILTVPGGNIDFFPPLSNAITIVNYNSCHPLNMYASCYRHWRGSLKYHIRMNGSALTQGYLTACRGRNVNRVIGKYDQFKRSPLLLRSTCSVNEFKISSYARTDAAGFRHLDLTIPYEYQNPIFDTLLWSKYRTDPTLCINGTPEAPVVLKSTDEISIPEYDDYIFVSASTELVNSVSGGQLFFEIEIAAGDDFEFYTPLPMYDTHFAGIDYNMAWKGLQGTGPNPMSPPTNAGTGGGLVLPPYSRPDPLYTSDGVDVISHV